MGCSSRQGGSPRLVWRPLAVAVGCGHWEPRWGSRNPPEHRLHWAWEGADASHCFGELRGPLFAGGEWSGGKWGTASRARADVRECAGCPSEWVRTASPAR